jgi:beta-glucosidase
VPRLGIPAMRWADGARGINSAYDGTSLPTTLALAASFNDDLAYRSGLVLGEEARTMAVDVVLAPFVNLARLPNSGTGQGEDPLLDGRVAVGMVNGIQSAGALTMTQQFIANVQGLPQGGGQFATEGYDFIVDDRTLHEIYLPPFEMAIRAGTTSIMAAYNKVNGDYNTQNERNLSGILREELGFQGWANSDWHANRVTLSITKGLDGEMPGVGPMEPEGYPPQFGAKLKTAIQAGQIPAADLDRAVGRRLTAMERFGMLDSTRKPPPAAIDVEKDAAVARAVATQGAVLLKNDGATLPLKPQALANLALIGPTASQLAAGGGGNRAYGFPDRLISPIDAMKASAPGVKITYAAGGPLTGVAIPASALKPAAGSGQGLSRDEQKGTPAVVEAVNYVKSTLPAGHSYVWKGTLSVPNSGAYTLEIASWGGSATLKVDGRQRGTSAKLAFAHGVPRRWTSLLPTTDQLDHSLATMQLEAGKSYAIEIEGIAEQFDPMQIRFGWITPQMRSAARAEAVAAAKAADTTVLFLWSGRGGDQNQGELGAVLPDDQNGLVDAVAAANPNTIVVMDTAAGVAMPWRDKVKAILDMWSPGQEGGWATTDLLLGKANPSGKLPITFPLKAEDSAPMAAGHPERYDGIADKKQVVFSEGIFTGYRWYDKEKITPMYPFGYGLSYTSFAYSGLKTAVKPDGVDVTFTVKNTGPVAGAEVAQVYVGPPPKEPVPMAVRSLSGYARVDLAPSESKTVTVHVATRQLSYWSVDKKGWIVAGGERPIQVGSSSRDIRLTGAARVRSDGQVATGPKPGDLGVHDMMTGRQTQALAAR